LGWGDGTTGALFGATRLSGRAIRDGTLTVQDESEGWSRTLRVERDGSLVKVTPQPDGNGKSLNFGCNVLDDPVWVDASTGIPQRCGANDPWQLARAEVGTGVAIPLGTATNSDRLLPLLPVTGILPPQADTPLPAMFTLRDAADSAAMNAQWAAYVQQGGNVALSDAHPSDGGSTCIASLCTRTLTWTLMAAADGKQALTVKVTRSFPPAGPSPPDSVEISSGEAPRSIGALSPTMAGLDDSRRTVANLAGTAPGSVQVFDDNYGHRPRYTYTFNLARRCLDPACQASTFDSLTVDARAGALMAGNLLETTARRFVPS
jgi:hypothetical protein